MNAKLLGFKICFMVARLLTESVLFCSKVGTLLSVKREYAVKRLYHYQSFVPID